MTNNKQPELMGTGSIVLILAAGRWAIITMAVLAFAACFVAMGFTLYAVVMATGWEDKLLSNLLLATLCGVQWAQLRFIAVGVKWWAWMDKQAHKN